MIPGPRPSQGHDPRAGRDRGADVPPSSDVLPDAPTLTPATEGSAASPPTPVALVRTARGWAVHSPTETGTAGDLIEGLSLADLVAEELGALHEPDRSARRSARGPRGTADEPQDPVTARIAELERTVTQLEHALAARVSTERAIGVLAERHGISARSAFESLRRDARSQGRPVVDLAREVLDGLAADVDGPAGGTSGRSAPATGAHRPDAIVAAVPPPALRVVADPSAVAATDGVS